MSEFNPLTPECNLAKTCAWMQKNESERPCNSCVDFSFYLKKQDGQGGMILELYQETPEAHKWGVEIYDKVFEAAVQRSFDIPYLAETARLKVIHDAALIRERQAFETLKTIKAKFWKWETTQLAAEETYKKAVDEAQTATAAYEDRDYHQTERRAKWLKINLTSVKQQVEAALSPDALEARATYCAIIDAKNTHEQKQRKLEREAQKNKPTNNKGPNI